MHTSADIPLIEPTEIIAGDTTKWRREDLSVHYPASQWTLTYALRGAGKIDLTATADGDNFAITVAASVSASWTAGDYWWSAYVTKASERYQIDSGTIKVKPNLAAVSTTTYEGRSHVKKVLDAIEAVIQGRASKDQMNYSIAGRSLAKTPIPDLIKLRDRYKAEYAQEIKAEKIANGEGSGGKILTRFR